MKKLLLICLIAVGLAACGDDAPRTAEKQAGDTHEEAGRMNLRGELVYAQRIALPPGATANVSLSGPGGGDESIITQIHLSDFGQVPIAFSLTFPDDAIESGAAYELRASINAPDGNPLWLTPEPLPIDPHDDSDVIQVQLQQVTAGESSASSFTYRCEGLSFKARVSPDHVTLELPERMLELPSVRSASGAKFSNGEVTFWTKGQEMALLEVDGKTYKNCTVAP